MFHLPPLRCYGSPPYSAAVLHGGPGAAGEAAPLAHFLAVRRGVLEPMQTAETIEGQVAELKSILQTYAGLPVALVGFSWGAWLAWIFAAEYPGLVSRLVLVSSGPFTSDYAAAILPARLARLNASERAEAEALLEAISNPGSPADDATLARVGALFERADAYDPLPGAQNPVEVNLKIYNGVWPAAVELRRSGKLLALADHIHCPVVAIHGEDDPHPVEGVAAPLAPLLANFTLLSLPHCGHHPWAERQARDAFFEALETALE